MEGKKNRNRIIGLRLTIEEYGELEKKWQKTPLKKLSEYVRRILFNKPVTVFIRDKSQDDLMAELIVLRQELNAIGNNFNQAVHRLHTLDHLPQMLRWLEIFERDKNVFFTKVDEVQERINLIADKWLQ
ncbi:plasmid mobilization relaxosome protein MobC [Mucilaginibacter ximonensis]|uniref:Plasmid mobilization relaxosome protein MobC n=1 Tax=Mucilaginibacter ximonensis TaxID=538021 RepID=A0ABW5Y9J2_9SPHI